MTFHASFGSLRCLSPMGERFSYPRKRFPQEYSSKGSLTYKADCGEQCQAFAHSVLKRRALYKHTEFQTLLARSQDKGLCGTKLENNLIKEAFNTLSDNNHKYTLFLGDQKEPNSRCLPRSISVHVQCEFLSLIRADTEQGEKKFRRVHEY